MKKNSFNISLKLKFISSFSIITLVLSSLSVFIYLTMKSLMNNLNGMIQTTIQVNAISTESEEITRQVIDQYILYKKEEDKNKIIKGLSVLDNNINCLKIAVKNEKGIQVLDEIDRLVSTFKEDALQIIKLLEEGNDFSNAIKVKENEVKNQTYLKYAVDEFISVELNYHKVLMDELNKKAEKMAVILMTLILICSVLSILGAVLFSNSIAGMISRLAQYAQSIAEGNLKVNKLEIKSKDDISVLANSFNKMGENLRSLIEKISKNSDDVAHSAELLKANTEQSTKAIEQVAVSIQLVAQGALELSEQSCATVIVVNELYEGNKKVYENVHKVLNTSEKAAKAALHGNDKMDILSNQIEVIEEKMVATQNMTEALKNKSNEIKKVLDTVANIASQTDLLALNAAIEAARAGEHGRGFAIVADEVRKLAESSANATREITEMLNEIQKDSEHVADSMFIGVNEVKGGMQMAEEAREAFNEIVSTREDVDVQIKGITEEIEKMVGEIQKVEGMSKDVLDIARKSSAGSDEVASAVEEQTSSLEEITSSSIILSDMAGELQKVVKQFRI